MVRGWYSAVQAASEPGGTGRWSVSGGGDQTPAQWASQLGVTSPTAAAATTGLGSFSGPMGAPAASSLTHHGAINEEHRGAQVALSGNPPTPSGPPLDEQQRSEDLGFLAWAESSGGRALVASELRALRSRAASRSVSQVCA
jgi:hypothetical protein